MKLTTRLLWLTCVFSISVGWSQNPASDSLKQLLKNATHDTTRCKILNEMIEAETDDNIWPAYNEQLKNLAGDNLRDNANSPYLAKFYKKYLAAAYNNIGYFKMNQGDLVQTLDFYRQSLQIQKEIDDKQGMVSTLINIGFIYESQGNIPLALDFYHQSLKICEQANDKVGVANALNNIAVIYQKQFDAKALDYYERSLKIYTELHDEIGISSSYNNLGSIYELKKEPLKALDYYTKSLAIKEKLGNKRGIAEGLNNVGSIYRSQGNNEKALEYYMKSLALMEELDNKYGTATIFSNIGSLYLSQHKLPKALEYGLKSMELSKQIAYPEKIQGAANLLTAIYRQSGDYKKAFEMLELNIVMRDSMNSQENKRASIKNQFRYEYEKKAAADSVKVAEEKKVIAVQLKQEKTQRYALYGGLALVALFGAFMFNRFKITQRQKRLIEVKEKETQQQKKLVEEKQKEIVDSITYAKRLQEAILPPQEFVDRYAPGNFMLYKPKDLVAGDFYWAEYMEGLFFIAAADSTGHGVPGAMVSVVCSNALNRCVKEFELRDTGKILDKCRELVLETFAKSGEEIKDGMDISLLCIDATNKKISWSGANNPLWYLSLSPFEEPVPNLIREGGRRPGDVVPKTSNDIALTEIKADKQPIGKTDDPKPFTTHELAYNPGDVFYLMTDGFADQFGGPKGKKFKYKQLEELLMSLQQEPLNLQKGKLLQAFNSWKGSLEQVDDVCIIGIRI